MRKFLVITIPIMTLVIFILIMLSGGILKKPLSENDDIPKSIQFIINDIESDNWKAAEVKAEELSDLWKQIVNRVQFSSERDEINAFSSSIARLRGAITAKDKSSSFIELYEAYEHWDQLGK